MGFGIILCGLALLIGVEAGFGVIGYPLICYGCIKLSRVHDDFKICAVLALLNIPYSAASGLTIFGVLPANNIATNCLNVMHYVFSAFMFWYFCMRIRAIAKEGDDEKLASNAIFNGLMAVSYCVWTLAVLFIPFIQNTIIAGLLVLLKYVLIIMGIFFLLSCGAKITTPSQMAKELADEIKREKKQASKK